MSPHNLLCFCQCSCWDWTDVTMAIIGAFTWPLLANVELNCWIYISCYRDLLKLLHRLVKLVTSIFRPMPKCSKRNAKDNNRSSNHLLSEHFQCVDIYKHVHPLSAIAATNIIHCIQTLSSCNIRVLNWWWHLSGFWPLKQINHLPSQIDECVDRVGSGNGSDLFYNWSEKSCDVDNLSQSILKGLACDKVETELEVMSFFPELSCACY